MKTKTFAAIDVGSYELSMKIYEVSGKYGMRQVDHIRHGIDMGTQTYATGFLSLERVNDLCDTLKEFSKIMTSYQVEDYVAYGTSAIRETKNMSILLDQIEQKCGIHVEVLSNSEQRFLDYKSIAFQGEKFDKYIEKGTAILDIGGGSIQLSLFEKDALVSTQNLKLGVLRILERMNTLKASLRQYEDLVDELLQAQLSTYKKLYMKDYSIDNLIIADDYFSTLVNRVPDRDMRGVANSDTVEKYINMIKTIAKGEISKSLGMAEDDIPILYISLLLIRQVMLTTGAKSIWAPGVTLCDGIAYEYAEKNENISTNHDFERDIIACAKQISKRYQGSNKRSETLEKLVLKIFDAIEKTHGLTKRDRLLLQISAHLHDCGKYISMANLSDCSYNIIKYTEIIGISHKERMILANVVKFNQSDFDYYEDFEDKESLEPADHMKVAKLTAILRLANGLDRSHKMKFKDVTVAVKENKMEILIESNVDVTLERGLFGNRADFFEQVFNLKPVIKQKRSI